MEELIKHLKNSYGEETESYDHYMTMADMAADHDKFEIAQMLRDMAWEERTHKEHLKHMLNILGADTEPIHQPVSDIV